MSDIQTQTLRLGSDSNIGVFTNGRVIRIWDIFVSAATNNPTHCVFFNDPTITGGYEMISVGADSVSATNSAASATNFTVFSYGIKFSRGCYFRTASNFGYASVTFSSEMA